MTILLKTKKSIKNFKTDKKLKNIFFKTKKNIFLKHNYKRIIYNI